MDSSEHTDIPTSLIPAEPSPASIPMTPSESNTTAPGGEEIMTPASSSAHSESDDSDTERASPTFPSTPSLQTLKPSTKTQRTFVKRPERKDRTLIDLPVDVLKEIVKEVNNTNDLVSLSLTCRCLHALSTPQIYSRFDIVWPDSNTVGDRSGVDALTYGLATLVASGPRGNTYGRWIRKFSLGNGPSDWVSEYNISKEGGKMLGTLVNLALMRMQNLETFNWDMPTGVLRDIFMSLHDLCPKSLKNVHVRFHDNSETAAPLSQDPARRVETPTFKGFKALRQLSVLDIDERQYLEEMACAIEDSVDTLRELRVGLAEHVLKTGKWIWDLDEGSGDVVEVVLGGASSSAVGGVMGILVGRICGLTERRRKLRGGVGSAVAVAAASGSAVDALAAPPVSPQAAEATSQPAVTVTADVGESEATVPPNPSVSTDDTQYNLDSIYAMAAAMPGSPTINNEVEALWLENDLTVSLPSPAVAPPVEEAALPIAEAALLDLEPSAAATPKIKSTKSYIYEEEKPYKQLKLETLDLERVPISVRVLQKVINWSILTNLTILNCPNHEKLWKMLRRKFSPYTTSGNSSSSTLPNSGFGNSASSSKRRSGGATPAASTPDYKIRLKKLHTDLVSPSLVAFIKETLPPNSLEILFLQENPQHSSTPTGYSSLVTIDMIYKCCIKRHRVSLRKLLVDSNVGSTGTYEIDKWRFNREVINFITTSGKMPRLRELGCTIDYKDWHFFLTRLPGISGLRSLYLPHVKGAVQMPQLVCKEMALQVVDVVSLRNEVEICYVGIMNKCFELLEGRDIDEEGVGDGIGVDDIDDDEEAGSDEDEEDLIILQTDGEEEEDEGVDEDEDEEGGAGGEGGQGGGALLGIGGAKDEESGDEAGGSGGGSKGRDSDKVRVQLREILFYDDKVAVFKARSGKL